MSKYNKIFPQNIKKKSPSVKSIKSVKDINKDISKDKSKIVSKIVSKAESKDKSKDKSKDISKVIKKDKKYIIGDYVDHNIRVISFSADSFTIYENQVFDIEILNQINLNIDKGLSLGKWKTYKYAFDSTIPNTIFTANGHGVYYNSLSHPDLENTNNIYYMLIKLNNNHYLSLGYIMFEFKTPDNDIIIKISDTHSKSGNQNIRFVGEKYSYAIDDGTMDEYNYYISNDDMKKYNIKSLFMNIYIDANIHKPYFNSYKKTNKLFKIQYKVFDVIHILDIKKL